jgi:hypothetical protein
MEFSQAAGYFNTVPLDGWNGSAWVSNIAYGDLMTYDRFLGPRTFGHLQRMFYMQGDGAAVHPYEVVRNPAGEIYIVASYNHDFCGREAYATSFLLQQALYTAQIITYTTVPAPSGIGGTKVESLSDPYYCHMERYTSTTSSEVDVVRYGTFIFTFPKSALAALSEDKELRVDGVDYELNEVHRVLNAAEARGMERGA